ncbi:MAG: hypothetical protein K6E85_12405 [Lachnospiraceae bacterium]|nr:hypothetical protein [Lachnospiraceae bacterium]
MKKILLFMLAVILLAAMLLTACTGYNNSTSLTENGVYYHLSSNHKEAMADSYQWNGKEDTTVITIPDTLEDGTPVTSMGGFIGIGVPVSFRIEYEVNWPEEPRNWKIMSEEERNAYYRDYADKHPDELFGHLVKLKAQDGGETAASGSNAINENTGSASGADANNENTTSVSGSNAINGNTSAASDTDVSNENADRDIIYRDITFTINIGKNVSGMGRQMSMYSICYEINHDGILQPDGSILVYRPTLYFNVDPENETFYAEDGVIYSISDGQPVVTDE